MDESLSPTRSQDEGSGAGPSEYSYLPGAESEGYHMKEERGYFNYNSVTGSYDLEEATNSTARILAGLKYDTHAAGEHIHEQIEPDLLGDWILERTTTAEMVPTEGLVSGSDVLHIQPVFAEHPGVPSNHKPISRNIPPIGSNFGLSQSSEKSDDITTRYTYRSSAPSPPERYFWTESWKAHAELPQTYFDHESDSEKSGKSMLHSIFDTDRRSRTTFPSSISNSNTKTKSIFQSELGTAIAPMEGHTMRETKQELQTELNVDDNFDVETAYSVDSHTNGDKFSYMQALTDQLFQDIKRFRSPSELSDIPQPYIDSVLKQFAWKLHEESSNPFQWETSVIIHKKRSELIALLATKGPEIHSTSKMTECDNESVSDDEKDFPDASKEEDEFRPDSFTKPQDMIRQWVDDIAPSAVNPERIDILAAPTAEAPTFQLPDYEKFIHESDAYQWLLSKLCHHDLLDCESPNLMSEIGARIRHKLRGCIPLQRISRRSPLSLVTMMFHVDWNIFNFFSDRKEKSQTRKILDHVVCLTGSWNNAQATTVAEYFEQTWPKSGGHILSLLAKILTQPFGEEYIYSLPTPNGSRLKARFQHPSSCFITVTGGLYFVSEIAEQIGWVASALRSSPRSKGVVSCRPRLEELNVVTVGNRATATTVVGSCSMFFDFTENNELLANDDGFCWSRLFCNPILVSGYPILRRAGSRPEANTGLEMSLGTMAYLVRSQQVVQWGNRIMIKGFNMLLVATLGTAAVLIWHLLVSENADERISYSDSRIDNSSIKIGQQVSLRSLEEMRHVVGWCSKATDHCGQATADLNLATSGLGKPPGSIVIDRLYLEGGSQLVGGLNMRINQKDRPFWLERESDYPSLLRWIGLQPIVFYDVCSRRAWLVDGISALLHLVRASLHRDEHDPESPYDWVFKSTDLKDAWDGFKGRQAALKTLKSWDNLNLNLYVKSRSNCEGKDVHEYVTLEERVKKILHSIEIIIDRQVKVTSEDGIKVAQKLDPRRTVVGFDILDVIAPIGPIGTRFQHLGFWSHGWVDLLPSIGVTTIFGNGFGDLIRPDDPDSMCSQWKSLPRGKDYMATSMSTLKMLYEKRFLRLDPTLGVGELTKDILWTSPSGLFKSCSCLNANLVGGAHHHNPVQILASKSRKLNLIMGRPRLVDMTKLDEKGAVVFGRSKDGRADGRSYEERNQDNISIRESNIAQETSSMESSVIQRMASSSIGSSDNQVTDSTVLTSPSLESPCDVEIGETDNASSTSRSRLKRIKRKWNHFNI